MRTTIPIDDDVLSKARKVAEKLNQPFRRVINDALRAGLQLVEEPADAKPYKTIPHKMGLMPGRNLDNVQELISQVELEDRK
jgi:hypothetical protein